MLGVCIFLFVSGCLTLGGFHPYNVVFFLVGAVAGTTLFALPKDVRVGLALFASVRFTSLVSSARVYGYLSYIS